MPEFYKYSIGNLLIPAQIWDVRCCSDGRHRLSYLFWLEFRINTKCDDRTQLRKISPHSMERKYDH